MTVMVYIAGKMRRPKGQRKTQSNGMRPSSTNNRYLSHGKPPKLSDERAEKQFWKKVLKMEQLHEAMARYRTPITGLQLEPALPESELVIDILLSLIARCAHLHSTRIGH